MADIVVRLFRRGIDNNDKAMLRSCAKFDCPENDSDLTSVDVMMRDKSRLPSSEPFDADSLFLPYKSAAKNGFSLVLAMNVKHVKYLQLIVYENAFYDVSAMFYCRHFLCRWSVHHCHRLDFR